MSENYEELKEAVADHIIKMDSLMKGPSTYKRGVKIAEAISKLQRVLEQQGPIKPAK